MQDTTHKTIYLKDYTPPNYLIESIDLFIELDEENTRVISKLEVKRNPDSKRPDMPLELFGEGLQLDGIKLNGIDVSAEQYELSPEGLMLKGMPERPFRLEIVTRINPKANTALEGLYLSNGMFCTQCEAQGFRKITYYPDRPDVMARFTTTLVADEAKYPVLLSNGNRVAEGRLQNGRHWVKWEDPFKKPCYLFALVGGSLACLEDKFTTCSGREITLQIFVEPHDLDKCSHAMASLKHSMRWDEETYGREYDLDLYMIVAVSHFNMGAMENKGLNIFNTKFVLARPDTATDFDYEHIEGVIGHEYFHNWTGNRITCRDWFQLSLKEGLTVFRDQQFSASQSSPAVNRIEAVNMLRTRQFAEDAGPLAHPIRPESYIEINNFYTLTVYEKGAEVVRMMHTLLGEQGFRRGTDLYFERHDGQAVTCDDFVKAMEDANGVDLGQFRRWYVQAGTPELELVATYHEGTGELELTVKQSCGPSPGQPVKQPFHIPLALGLLSHDGKDLPLQLAGEAAPANGFTRVLEVREPQETFRFVNLAGKPVVSPLRGFSAPVRLKCERGLPELAFLFAHDPDAFNRWDAGQALATQVMQAEMAKGSSKGVLDPLVLNAYRQLVQSGWDDLSYLSLLLTLPSEDYINSTLKVVDPVAVHETRRWFIKELAVNLGDDFKRLYETHHVEEFDRFDSTAVGRRRLKNTCLAYLSELDTEASHELTVRQFREARGMTDQVAALSVIVNSHNPLKDECLNSFYQQWQAEDLVVGKWFSLQATCTLPGTLERVKGLLQHPAFDMKTPNHVRSLIGAFAQANPVNFHALDGSGYVFLADHVIELNALNPQIASRMVTALTSWKRFDNTRQKLMREQLQRVADTKDLSNDVYEVAQKSLV